MKYLKKLFLILLMGLAILVCLWILRESSFNKILQITVKYQSTGQENSTYNQELNPKSLIHFNIKSGPNNVLNSNPKSTLISKTPIVTTSNTNFNHQSSQISNSNTAAFHLIKSTSSSNLNKVSKPITTHATSNSISSSRLHQVLEMIAKPVPMSRRNLGILSNYKYRYIKDIASMRSSINSITTVSTSISSTTIHPKFRPKVSSTPKTNARFKSAIKIPPYSIQQSKTTTIKTSQGTIYQQQSNITTNTPINNHWNKKCMNITQIVLERIDYLQNPNDCSSARKVICDQSSAGMGSTVHHWVYCLIFAYYTNRTMVIDTSRWLYLKNVRSRDGVNDFHDLFLPISKCKYTNHDKKIAVLWNNTSMDSTDANKAPQVIRLLRAGILLRDRPPGPEVCHYTMPAEIFYNIIKLKYKPMAWWTGLLAQYIVRPNDYLRQFIDQSRKQFQFQSPIVGVHIRRTDKRREAKLFNIDQYMIKVKAFFDNLANRNISVERRVFVTTDEPHLISKLKSKYTNYQFIHPPLQQLQAGPYTTRYSALHLKHFMRDLYLLAECDYLVVTMTSNVGRLAYELHEVIYSTTQNQHFTSLDIDYNIFGQTRNGGPWIMQANRHANISKQFNLMKGDILDSCESLDKKYTRYRCYSQRLQKSGSFPASYVTYLLDDDRTFPDYSKVDRSMHAYNIDQRSNHSIQNICEKSSINDIQL